MNATDLRPASVLKDNLNLAWVVMSIAADEVLVQTADENGDPADDGEQVWITFDGMTDEGWAVSDY